MMKLIFFTQTLLSRRGTLCRLYFKTVPRLLSTFILKTVNLTKRNREKTSGNRPFLAKISDLNTGICGLGRHRSAAIAAPKSHAITFLTPWEHVGRGRWLWSGQIHLPWPSRALKMGKKLSKIWPCGAACGNLVASLRGDAGDPRGYQKHRRRSRACRRE